MPLTVQSSSLRRERTRMPPEKLDAEVIGWERGGN
jgi:hypothetical protein